ncbi:hypothetical protein ACIBCT_31750 [Streptosporangium sp. NPDC050855]|uniref:hypothetical protein n=1 Tax=Streptosporangium sp. NPDC050855 TaxID=3366194 RepID=UPI0037A4EFD8
MTFATTPTRRSIILGVALAVGATVLGAPSATAGAPPEGAYWHTRTLTTSTHSWRFGTDSNPYSLVERYVSERWSTPDGRAWYGCRAGSALTRDLSKAATGSPPLASPCHPGG